MRERLVPIALGVIGVLLLAVVVLLVLRSRPDGPETGPDGAEAPANAAAENGEAGGESDVQLSDVSVTISEEGEVVWRASFGGEVEMDEQQQLASATDVLWEFQGEGFEGLTLKAPLMRASWEDQRLSFSGGIAIEGEGGKLKFSAKTAEYQFSTQKVIGRGDVRFQRGNYFGRAEEVVVDNKQKTVRLKRGTLTRVQ
jgi:hypothetical protein